MHSIAITILLEALKLNLRSRLAVLNVGGLCGENMASAIISEAHVLFRAL